MNWKIRDATIKDLEEIHQVELACFEEEDVFHKETFEFFLTRKGVTFLLACAADTDRIIGFIIANPKAFTTFEIVTIDVHPNWQSKGIGTNFLEIIEKRITKKILDHKISAKTFSIELVVYVENSKAKKLYEKCGYQLVAKLANYYSQGRDGLKMEKKIVLK